MSQFDPKRSSAPSVNRVPGRGPSFTKARRNGIPPNGLGTRPDIGGWACFEVTRSVQFYIAAPH
jgi:hypothetical protein